MPSTISAGTTAGTAIAIAGDTTGNLAFQTNGTTTAMTITTSQNVGIGTATPGDKLTIVGAPSTYINVQSTNASTGSGLYTSNATRSYLIGAGAASGNSNLEFRDVTGSATRMSLDTSGNLGIGVIPSYRLDVSGASVVANINSTNNNNVLAISNASTLGGYIGATGTNLLFANNAGTEAMRINSSANVTIGTTSASARLTVNSTGTTIGLWTSSVNNHGIYGEATGTGYGVYGRAYNSSYGGCIGFDASNTVYGIIGYTTYALQTNASINVNGTIYASDGRLKENIKPIDSALNKIAQLNPVSFDWKANSTRGIINKNTPLPDYGLIAQEVEQVLPDIVYETQSPSLPNNTPASQSLEAELGTYKGVDYSRLIPFLTKAIQELKAELDVAKAEIQALKGAQ